MFELSGVYSFDSRIAFLDNLFNKITENNKYKFYILSILHYTGLFIGLSTILFSNNIYLLSISIFIIIKICIVNFIDDGCLLMKLERKYIGKEWFGLVTCFNLIFPDLINKQNITYIFIISTTLILFYAVFKLYKIIKKSKKETLV